MCLVMLDTRFHSTVNVLSHIVSKHPNITTVTVLIFIFKTDLFIAWSNSHIFCVCCCFCCCLALYGIPVCIRYIYSFIRQYQMSCLHEWFSSKLCSARSIHGISLLLTLIRRILLNCNIKYMSRMLLTVMTLKSSHNQSVVIVWWNFLNLLTFYVVYNMHLYSVLSEICQQYYYMLFIY